MNRNGREPGEPLDALDYPQLPLTPTIDQDRLSAALQAVLDLPRTRTDFEWVQALAAWHHLRLVASGQTIEPNQLAQQWNIGIDRWIQWDAFLTRATLIRKDRRVDRFTVGGAWPGARIITHTIDLRSRP